MSDAIFWERLTRFLRRDLPFVFDVGANVGDKASLYVSKGARVVCFEPQPACVKALQQRFEREPNVTIVPAALGPANGEAELSICSDEPTLSTFAASWKQGRFKDKVWDDAIAVPVSTLDAAIEKYGLPFYCKIDVEGFEASVLAGLTRRIPVISFEFCAEGLSETEKCLTALARLGYRTFNVSLGENGPYRFRAPIPPDVLLDHLRALEDPLAWGDVFAAPVAFPRSSLLPRRGSLPAP